MQMYPLPHIGNSCISIHLHCCSFYGAPLWYFKSDGIEAICVAWCKALRTKYKVHPATHCDVITALSGHVPLLSNLKVRFDKFFKKYREHKNKIVKAAATAALVNPMSCAGSNYREVMNACYDKKIIYNEWNSKCDEMKDCVNVSKEMIDIRDGFKQCYILSSDDIGFIIEDICIN